MGVWFHLTVTCRGCSQELPFFRGFALRPARGHGGEGRGRQARLFRRLSLPPPRSAACSRPFESCPPTKGTSVPPSAGGGHSTCPADSRRDPSCRPRPRGGDSSEFWVGFFCTWYGTLALLGSLSCSCWMFSAMPPLSDQIQIFLIQPALFVVKSFAEWRGTVRS